MDCAAVKPKMEALVNGSLPKSERAFAEQHISICEGCRLELELVRAIGSQEKPPAIGQEDWTIDRIFGPDAGGGAQAQSSPASPGMPEEAPAPVEIPADGAIFPGMDSDSSSSPVPVESALSASAGSDEDALAGVNDVAGNAKGESNAWDFEPADAKADVKPPEESLFFATEALNRRGAEDKKSSNLRVILWGAGSIVGAALLAFSSWFVLHMAAPSSEKPGSAAHQMPSPGAPGESPSQESPPAPAPDPGAVQPPAGDGGAVPADQSTDAPDMTTQGKPAAPAPRMSASSNAPQPIPLGSSAMAPPAESPRVSPPAPSPVTSAPRQVTSAPKPVTPAPTPVTPAPRPASEPEHRAADEPFRPAEPDTPEPDTKSPSPASTPAPSMWRTETPKAEPAVPAPGQSAMGEVTPIQRLHLATVAAEERGDLVTLRKLRSTWKSFMEKIIGPDRARAKREYADCLWAIQSITGRRADQKDTLAAYREYLLGAPAGGADSRSVSRLRQLEDAISEHH